MAIMKNLIKRKLDQGAGLMPHSDNSGTGRSFLELFRNIHTLQILRLITLKSISILDPSEGDGQPSGRYLAHVYPAPLL